MEGRNYESEDSYVEEIVNELLIPRESRVDECLEWIYCVIL